MKSKINTFIVSSGLFALAAPLITFGQTKTANTFNYSTSIVAKIIGFLQDFFSAVFPVITAGLIIVFAYTVFKFMKDDSAEKEIYKNQMTKALFALLIWFTFFGIITVVANSLGFNTGDKVGVDNVTRVDFK